MSQASEKKSIDEFPMVRAECQCAYFDITISLLRHYKISSDHELIKLIDFFHVGFRTFVLIHDTHLNPLFF